MDSNDAAVPALPPLDGDSELALTAQLVAAYCMGNSVATANLPAIIATVHETITGLGKTAEPVEQPQAPAVPVAKSVTPGHLVCLEDGLTFKSLKRHLRVSHGLTPAEYRQKWDLDHNYPMVAPDYARFRSSQALSLGLGRKAAPPPPPAPVKKARAAAVEAPAPAPVKTARPARAKTPAAEKPAVPEKAPAPEKPAVKARPAATEKPAKTTAKEDKNLPPFRYPANRFAKKST